jgi:hypothetical protein
MADYSKKPMIPMGGLWLKQAHDGSKFMVGNIGLGGKILIFKNKNKKQENSPDYFIFLAPPSDKDELPKTDDTDNSIPF